jgi:hypothetical protein
MQIFDIIYKMNNNMNVIVDDDDDDDDQNLIAKIKSNNGVMFV